MTQNRKYFGMTSTQIGILAGLAVAVIVLFVVAALLVFRGGLGGLAPAPQPTPSPQATLTPFIIPTITPTQTLTPVPYEMLIPEGWLQFKTSLVEIWLPKEFKLSKTKTTVNSANLASLELVASGAASKASQSKMWALISYEPLTGDSLDAYLANKLATLSAKDIRVADKRAAIVNSQDAVRFVLETRIGGRDFNNLIYVFLDGGTVWYVEYSAELNEYFTLLETFEKSARTFRVVQ